MKKTIQLTEANLKNLIRRIVKESSIPYYKKISKGLAYFIDDRKKGYKGKPEWMWKDEGLIYAVLDYYGSRGEFTPEDMKTLAMYFGNDMDEILDLCHEGEECNINEGVSEMDWKVYANAAKKRLQQYHDNPQDKEKFGKYYDLEKYANQKFDDDFVGLLKYDTMGDKATGKHSPKFSARFNLGVTDRMPYGAINGYNKSGDKLFSIDKGIYHSSKGVTTPGKFFKDKEVADAFTKANDELWDYANGNYEYQKGKGWVNKGGNLDENIRRAIRKCLNEAVSNEIDKDKIYDIYISIINNDRDTYDTLCYLRDTLAKHIKRGERIDMQRLASSSVMGKIVRDIIKRYANLSDGSLHITPAERKEIKMWTASKVFQMLDDAGLLSDEEVAAYEASPYFSISEY